MQSLPADALPGLRESLVKCINMQPSEQQAVTSQLCIAMSALIVQWTEWPDVLQYLGDHLGTNMVVNLPLVLLSRQVHMQDKD